MDPRRAARPEAGRVRPLTGPFDTPVGASYNPRVKEHLEKIEALKTSLDRLGRFL
jgi:hypothetical protein